MCSPSPLMVSLPFTVRSSMRSSSKLSTSSTPVTVSFARSSSVRLCAMGRAESS